MTREELRRGYLADCDRALLHPYIIGADTITRIKAMRELIVTSDQSMDQLVSIYNSQKKQEQP